MQSLNHTECSLNADKTESLGKSESKQAQVSRGTNRVSEMRQGAQNQEIPNGIKTRKSVTENKGLACNRHLLVMLHVVPVYGSHFK